MEPYFKSDKGILYNCDILEIGEVLEPNSVHCIVTSPPYWGKRKYNDDNEFGLEKTIPEYVDKIVTVFRNIKNALHDSGSLWLNIGDNRSYPSTYKEAKLKMKPGVPMKNLLGIPWMVALALQKDGWFLRSSIIWYKNVARRESAEDRLTDEHEYIFLLTKKPYYFFDYTALLTPVKNNVYTSDERKMPRKTGGVCTGRYYGPRVLPGKRLGDVWTIPIAGVTDGHIAVFPSEIPKRCIKAGTSERGCCSKCGAFYERVLKREDLNTAPRTVDWKPTCTCDADINPCVVLDPFMGRGTTALVAEALNRNWIGVEKYKDTCELIKQNMLSRKYGLTPIEEPEKGLFDITKDDIAVTA